MGKKSATSLTSSSPPSLWRRYRLALVIISLLALTWLLFDHQSLTLEDQPQTKDATDSFGGLGATLVDSLDTLYIMGLDQQFQRARDFYEYLLKAWIQGNKTAAVKHYRSEARAACDAAEYCVETQVDAGSLGRGRTACRLFKQSKPDMRKQQQFNRPE
ncbi:hypothetical protein ACLB2K_035616 [Fragaria x ananassa]